MGREEWCGFELSFELGFCRSIAYRVWEFTPCDRALMRKVQCPWNCFFCFEIRIVQVSAEELDEWGWDVQVELSDK